MRRWPPWGTCAFSLTRTSSAMDTLETGTTSRSSWPVTESRYQAQAAFVLDPDGYRLEAVINSGE